MFRYIKNKIIILKIIAVITISITSGCTDTNLVSDFESNNSCQSPPIRTIENTANADATVTKQVNVDPNNNNWQPTGFKHPGASSALNSISIKVSGSIKIAQEYGTQSDGCSIEDLPTLPENSFEYALGNSQVQNFLCTCIPDRSYTTVNPFGRTIGHDASTVSEVIHIQDTETSIFEPCQDGTFNCKVDMSAGQWWWNRPVPFSCLHTGHKTDNEPATYFGYCCNALPDHLSSKSDLGNYLVQEKLYKNMHTEQDNWYSCPMMIANNSNKITNITGSNFSYEKKKIANQNYLYGGRGRAFYVPADGNNNSKMHGKTIDIFSNNCTKNNISNCNCDYKLDWGNQLMITVANPMDDFNVALLSTSNQSNNNDPGYAFLSRWTWDGAFAYYWGSYLGGDYTNALNYVGQNEFSGVPYSNPLDAHYCAFNPDCSKGNELDVGQMGMRDCQDASRPLSSDVNDFQTNGMFGSCWNVNGRGLTASIDDKEYFPLDPDLAKNTWNHKNSTSTFFASKQLTRDNNIDYFVANYNSCTADNQSPGCDKQITIQDNIYSHFVENNTDSLKLRIYNTQVNPIYESKDGKLVGFGSTGQGKMGAVKLPTASNWSHEYLPDDKALTKTQNNYEANMYKMVGGYTVFVKAEPYFFPDTKQKYNLYGCFSSSENAPDVNNSTYAQQLPGAQNSNIIKGCEHPFEITKDFVYNASIGDNVGTLYLLFVDPGDYSNNSGGYTVDISTNMSSKATNILSDIITIILSPFEYLVSSSTNAVLDFTSCQYAHANGASCNVSYSQIIMLLLTLYIIIYTISFMFGVVQISQADLVFRVIKIAVIIGLLSPEFMRFLTGDVLQSIYKTGYDLVMVVLNFTNRMDYNAISSATKYSLIHLSGPYFQMFNFTIGIFTESPEVTILQLLAILCSGLSGVMIFILIVVSIFNLMASLIKMVEIFALSYFFIAILILLTPIFLPCLLFSQTKHLTDKWFKLIIRYSLEPMIIFVGAFMINAMLIVPIISIFDFSVCFKCAVPLLGLGFLKQFLGDLIPPTGYLLCIPSYLPWGSDNQDSGIPMLSFIKHDSNIIYFNDIIVFIILTSLMKKYINSFGSQITAWLTNTLGLTVSLTDAVGRDNLEGRREQKEGSFEALDSGFIGALRGKGFGNGMIARRLGLDSNLDRRYESKHTDSGYLRQRMLDNLENDRLDIIKERSEGIQTFRNAHDMLSGFRQYKQNMEATTLYQKRLASLNKQYTDLLKKSETPDLTHLATIARNIHAEEAALRNHLIATKQDNEEYTKKLLSTTNADLVKRHAVDLNIQLQQAAGKTVEVGDSYNKLRETSNDYNMLASQYNVARGANEYSLTDLTADLAADQQLSSSNTTIGNLTLRRVLSDDSPLGAPSATEKAAAVTKARQTLDRLRKLYDSPTLLETNTQDLVDNFGITITDYSKQERVTAVRSHIEAAHLKVERYIEENK